MSRLKETNDAIAAAKLGNTGKAEVILDAYKATMLTEIAKSVALLADEAQQIRVQLTNISSKK